MLWLWLALGLVAAAPASFGLLLLWYYLRVKRRYLPYIVRIFEERPLFIIPRGEPVQDAEEVRLTTPDGLTLRGCYLPTPRPHRLGVILFGLEYGSNRWACAPYTHFLRAAGFDIFAFEPRGQGESDGQPGYEPMQWVTEFEVHDFQTALAYLKTRHDADPRGIGFFGISKGGSAGMIAGAQDPFVRCFATDGIFATHTTMLPYIRKWATIYVDRFWVHWILPNWMYGVFARACLRRIRKQRGLRFPHLEYVMPHLTPRPLLMIHGGADTYIKPEMAKTLFDMAGEPREFWLVEGAKHNQAMHIANGDYQRRILTFFQQHLANGAVAAEAAELQALERHPPPVRLSLVRTD